MSTNRTPDDDKFEAEFLRRYADQLGAELSEDSLAKALGIDAFTDENLERWFIERMNQWLRELDPRPRETIVQTEPASKPSLRPAARRRDRP